MSEIKENWKVGDRVVISKDCPNNNMDNKAGKHGVIIALQYGSDINNAVIMLDYIGNPGGQDGWYTRIGYFTREVAPNNRANLQYMKRD